MIDNLNMQSKTTSAIQEMSGAASSLSAEAKSLLEAVANFKLDDGQKAAVRPGKPLALIR